MKMIVKKNKKKKKKLATCSVARGVNAVECCLRLKQ